MRSLARVSQQRRFGKFFCNRRKNDWPPWLNRLGHGSGHAVTVGPNTCDSAAGRVEMVAPFRCPA